MPEAPKPLAALWSAQQLPLMPEFLSRLLLKAQHELDLERLIIFGSRERGDHTPTSDYDLCFVLRSAEG
ncbi:MAG: nucleotidyltransferase domain-containing protein [Proteobacteria bacterium]|nr:nucleotidyltransferase domain-containing protein [Pseudomonadota bacterium]